MINRNFIFVIFLLFAVNLISQGQSNPFDLADDQAENNEEDRVDQTNPFEIPKSDSQVQAIEQKEIKTIDALDRSQGELRGFYMGSAGTILVSLALLLTFFRGVFNDFFESSYRDRRFNQLFRRMKSIWVLPNILFYFFFSLTVGVFVFLTMQYFDFVVPGSPFQGLLLIVGSILVFFLIKHLLLEYLGSTFEISNETDRYGLLIMSFNILLGVVITPIVLLLLLGPANLVPVIIGLGFILTICIIGLFFLRALSISNRFILQHSFHFFMYLCTVEIAPLFIIAKVIT